MQVNTRFCPALSSVLCQWQQELRRLYDLLFLFLVSSEHHDGVSTPIVHHKRQHEFSAFRR